MSVLYHASPQNDLAKLEPQRTLSSDVYIGDYVFATENGTLAMMYLTTKGCPTLMNPYGDQPSIVICSTENDYVQHDNGGTIYELPAEAFTKSPQREISQYELASRSAVIPLNRVRYSSSLGAMHDAGIAIHFADSATFEKLIGNPDQSTLINELPTYQGNAT